MITKIIFLVIACIAIIGCKNPRESKTIEHIREQDEVTYITPEQNVEEMLNIRNKMIEQKYLDSIYITMPDEAIIMIASKNLDCSIYDVANEYIQNKTSYDNIIIEINRIESYKKHKLQNPDNIPNKDTADIGNLIVIDEINGTRDTFCIPRNCL